MIEETYASKRPTVVQAVTNFVNQQAPWYTEQERKDAIARKITVVEFTRRTQIVKDLFNECLYDKGDVVYPQKYKEFQKYGACKIIHVVNEYKKMGTNETWPKNDNPMIVAFHPLSDPQRIINCTTNFLQVNVPVEEGVC